MELLNLTEYCLAKNAKDLPNKPALILIDKFGEEAQYSYQELYEKIIRLANGLNSLRLKPFSRFIFRARNSLDFFLLFFASIRAGLVPNASFPLLKAPEVMECIQDVHAALYYEAADCSLNLTLPSYCKLLSQTEFDSLKAFPFGELPSTRSNDPAFIVFTSGSTSKPKGVIHAHRVILAREIIREYWVEMAKEDTVFHTRTPHWTYTMGINFFDTWVRGATAVSRIQTPTVEECLQTIEKFKVTVFATIPSMYKEIVQWKESSQFTLPSLRIALSAGEYLDPAIESQWQKIFHKPIYQALGTTEMATPISESPKEKKRLGSIGKIQPGRRIEIFPVDGSNATEPVPIGIMGFLAFHKDNLGFMLGYTHQDPGSKKHFRGPWYITGDLVKKDGDGYLWHYGRESDILKIRGAIRVSSKEIEHVFSRHPQIGEVACTTTKNEQNEDILTLCVAAKTNASPNLEDELRKFVSDKLSDMKIPERILFLKELPRNPNGKIDYRKLKLL